MLNITGSRVVEDVNYRYKMPRMVARTEGRGNGIKTVIVNMSDIATSLNRPPELVTKFFGVDLGAQSKYDEEADKCTVNGAHTTPDLQKLLNIFIDKFVLCPNCHLPESALVVRKGMIYHKCSACGAKEAVDLSHKLCVFILRTAELELAKVRDAEAAEKKARKDKKAAAAAAGAAGDGGVKVKKEKKAGSGKKAKAAAAAAAAATAGEDGEDEEAGAAGAEEEEEEDDDDDNGLTPAAAVAAKRAAIDAAEAAASTAAAAANGGGSAAALSSLQAALEALLAAPKDAARAKAVGAAAKGGKQADVFSALSAAALSGGDALPLLKAVPVALNALYDADIVEEEACNAWYAGQVDERVRSKAKPFMEWLAAAEDEDEEEEEEKEGV